MSGDGGSPTEVWRSFYRERCQDDIRELVEEYPQERSLYVDVLELYEFDSTFTEALFSQPERCLQAGRDALRDLVDGFERVNVRLTNHPGLLSLDGLRSRHVSELVTVEGVVAAVDPVQSSVVEAVFSCPACGEAVRRRAGSPATPPGRCDSCGAHGPLQLDEGRSTFVDVQRTELTRPTTATSDEGPSVAIDAVLDDDLVTTVQSSDRLLATGIVSLDAQSATNRFDFYLDVVSIDREPGEVRREVDDAANELQRAIESRWELLADPSLGMNASE